MLCETQIIELYFVLFSESEAGGSRPVSRGIPESPLEFQPMDQQSSVPGFTSGFNRQLSNDQLLQHLQQQQQHQQQAAAQQQPPSGGSNVDMMVVVKTEGDLQQPMDCTASPRATSAHGATATTNGAISTANIQSNPVTCSSPTSPNPMNRPVTLEDLKAALQRQAAVTLGAGTQGQDSLSRMSEAVQSIQSPGAGSTGARQKIPPSRSKDHQE